MSLWVLLSSSWGCMHWDSPFHIFWFHFRLKSFHTFLQCAWVSSNQELWLSSWVSSVQFSHSVMSGDWVFATPWAAAHQASLSVTNSQSLLKLMSIELVMPSNYLILCHSLLLLPSRFPSIRIFSNKSFLYIRWPQYWSFSFSPSSEYSGLISFRMDWFDILAVQGTLKSLQHHSSKAPVLQCSAFFIHTLSNYPALFIPLSHLCVATGKIIALTRWT